MSSSIWSSDRRKAQRLDWVCDRLSRARIACLFPVRSSELVRRVLAKPLPKSRINRWLLAGGAGPGWPIVIALIAFVTIITAVLSRGQASDLVLALAAGTVATCWMVITFSFALLYARRDIERGGLKFPGSDEPVFTDYSYLAIGCSATFATTDTAVVSSTMRRLVSVHSVLALLLNTVVVAVLIAIIVDYKGRVGHSRSTRRLRAGVIEGVRVFKPTEPGPRITTWSIHQACSGWPMRTHGGMILAARLMQGRAVRSDDSSSLPSERRHWTAGLPH